MIEIPDSAAAELHARKVSLEARAYEFAFETTYADRSNKPDHQMSLMSRTRGRVKNLASLGEPSLLASDAGACPRFSCSLNSRFHNRLPAVRSGGSFKKLDKRRWASRDKLFLLFVESDRGCNLDCS
jgi:hypothetical protein